MSKRIHYSNKKTIAPANYNSYLPYGLYITTIFISNSMTRGKLVIKCPEGEGGLLKARGNFTNLPSPRGHLINNLPTCHAISL